MAASERADKVYQKMCQIKFRNVFVAENSIHEFFHRIAIFQWLYTKPRLSIYIRKY